MRFPSCENCLLMIRPHWTCWKWSRILPSHFGFVCCLATGTSMYVEARTAQRSFTDRHCGIVFGLYQLMTKYFFSMAQQPPVGPGPHHYRGFTIILRHTTLGRTPLDERSARRRDLYLTTHNTHNRQTSMSPVGFEPAIPVSEWLQNHALDRAATGIGFLGVSRKYLEHCYIKQRP
jgi:hypothetical protein